MKRLIVLVGFLSLMGSAVGMTEEESEYAIGLLDDSDDLTIVRKLVIENRVNEKDEYNRTPLMWAAWEAELAALKALIKDGADVNAVDSLGRTPLILAALAKRPDIVKELIENNANADAVDSRGYKALDYGWNNKEFYKILYPKTTGAWRRRYSQRRYTVPAAIAAAAYLGYKKPWRPGK